MPTQGCRIKEVRQKLNMTQEEMGNIFGASKSYISLAERDKCNFSVSQLIKLLLDYNVNLNYILGGVGTPFIHEKSENTRSAILAEIDKILLLHGID